LIAATDEKVVDGGFTTAAVHSRFVNWQSFLPVLMAFSL
jgi:hypothetical protein